jgi:2-aminoadipate transaminase
MENVMGGVPQQAVPDSEFTFPLAAWARAEKQPMMRELLALLTRPGLLSFGHVHPAPELFPSAAYAEATSTVLRTDPGALSYHVPSVQLKSKVVELMKLRGVQCTVEQVFLTAGAQHAMSLLARLLLDPGSAFVLDDTLYEGIRVVTQPFQPELLAIPARPAGGMDVDAVESLLAGGARPRFIYVIPDGHNPLGASLPLEERHRLVELARSYGVPILEDDAYGLLGFDGGFGPPLYSLDPERVIYIGSFSKILAPSLRLGWIVATPGLIPRLSAARQASDIDVASLTQRAVAAMLDGMDVGARIGELRREYALRLETMVKTLAEHFPPGTVWYRPQGGMVLWVELPPHMDARALLRAAVEEERIGFIPGEAFTLGENPKARHSLRLTFSGLPPRQIAEGMQRLGRVARRLSTPVHVRNPGS